MPLFAQVNCDLILDWSKWRLYYCRGTPCFIWDSLIAGFMDPRQPAALPLQLHGNRFATSSGQLPKLSAGSRERRGGGGGQHSEQQKMTSSAPVSSRLNPHGQSECLLEPGVHCHAKGTLGSKRLLTIWHSGVIFPWMTLRTTYPKASGKLHLYVYLKYKGSAWNKPMQPSCLTSWLQMIPVYSQSVTKFHF